MKTCSIQAGAADHACPHDRYLCETCLSHLVLGDDFWRRARYKTVALFRKPLIIASFRLQTLQEFCLSHKRRRERAALQHMAYELQEWLHVLGQLAMLLFEIIRSAVCGVFIIVQFLFPELMKNQPHQHEYKVTVERKRIEWERRRQEQWNWEDEQQSYFEKKQEAYYRWVNAQREWQESQDAEYEMERQEQQEHRSPLFTDSGSNDALPSKKPPPKRRSGCP